MLSVSRKTRSSEARGIPSAIQPTSRIGPYRLCLELATGGMSVIYLAYSDKVPGVVALKLISPEFAREAGYMEMFMDEAELASRIRHPNVCTVFDYDTNGQDYYLAMEYLVGEPVGAIRRKSAQLVKVDPEMHACRVARLLSDVCEGLHAAHELTDAEGEPLNIVHRDISPENLFLTYDGVPKIVDFGLVCAAKQHHRTRTGIIKGKVAYIAPEQLKGQRADRRTDIWGVGVVAWELLTGQRLFRRDTDLDTLRAVVDDPIPLPSVVQPGLPPDLDSVVMRALQRDPADRYQSAQQLGRDLLRIAVSGSEVVSSSELARWMSELFPGGQERRRQLVDLATQINVAGDNSPPTRVEHPTFSSTPPRPTLPPPSFDKAEPQVYYQTPPPPDIQSPDGKEAISTSSSRPPATPSPQRFFTPSALVFAVVIGASIGSLSTIAVGSLRNSHSGSPSAPPQEKGPSFGPSSGLAHAAPAKEQTTPITTNFVAGNLDLSAQMSLEQDASRQAVVRGPVVIELSNESNELVMRIKPQAP